MRLLPTSLTGRLVVTVVALVAVVSLLVAGVATVVMRSYLTGQLDRQVEASLERSQRVFGGQEQGFDPGDDRDGRQPPPDARGNRDGTLTAIIGTDRSSGFSITSSGEGRELSSSALEALEDVEPGHDPVTEHVPGLGSFRVVAAETTAGTLVLGVPTDDVDDTIQTLIWWEVLLGLAGVGVAAVAGRVLVRRQLQPLREVAATAHEVTAMPLSSGEVGETVRVPDSLTDPSTEVGQVGEALNQMLGHVERALDARYESEQQARQFLADASHELRTPLSTIKGYAELGRRSGRADPDGILAKVESEAGRMSTLVEDMLLLARLDAGRELERRPVDLTRLVVEAVNDARVVDPERRWTLDVPEEPVIVTGDEQRLHQAVTNLITNATRHTPPGTTVEVRLSVGDEIRIDVHDDGPGIDPALLPTVFERFTRGDSSRTRASGGAGLGMSLVKAIMTAHHGTASVTSSPGDTTFTLTLPA
ncbi:HAMP domain-containing sensor histidine kinase [Aeromicrobium wangtongii]|uniref:histidine kinase n=1 Tax=Aeromicrobium wangtongii TaxID=2969247 RepID=A0ABY5MC82_9ACTN|nr:HAMP domain-containing sensor histidine kinase [Aeromicrobium wangtongii]MCD9197090.1 HAMP domain-containing histidine kinase [Aeromicrobium wangtongii]UUP14590.1 HAMP domain-containing histidine kinase [Aeromicrobium wangtongii]